MTDAYSYRVYFRLLVDHPEARDASFAPVKPGHAFRSHVTCASLGEALNVRAEFCSGAYDFAAECVTEVELVRRNLTRGTERVVRSKVTLNPERVKVDYARSVRELEIEMGYLPRVRLSA
jgi:hypothetical protein